MKRVVNIVPMAGAGKRFSDAGYTVPKPLIDIDGQPMVVRAARSLPSADRWIFLCREEDLQESNIAQILEAEFPDATVVSVRTLTAGQAATCLLAVPHLNSDDAVHIGPCDSAVDYSGHPGDPLDMHPMTDVLVWTFRGNRAVLRNPRMDGWVETRSQGRALRVSVKVPISETPLRDHAVVGAFSFRRASDFQRTTEQLMASNRRTNGEFYMDDVVNVAIEAGLNVDAFEVKKYVCWGTPADLEEYVQGKSTS